MWGTVKLLRVAAAAERLRWQRTGRSVAIRAALGAAAAVFAVLMLAMLHLAAFERLSRELEPFGALLVIAGVDLVIAALLAWLAARETVDPVSLEAEHIRDQALRQVGERASLATLLLPLRRGGGVRQGLVGTAVTAAVIGLLTRR